MSYPPVGTTHGRLTIVAYIPGSRHPKVRVRCECGTEKTIQRDNLERTHSCGCLRRELTGRKNLQHGLSQTPEFKAWAELRQRCLNPNHKSFPDWGGRGILVCERWANSFPAFYKDMGPRPTPRHSIDRIDNMEGYTPTNCRWATAKEQRVNQRRQVLYTYKGITATLKDHARRVGLSYSAVHQRMTTLHWTLERVLTTPVQIHHSPTES